MGRSHAVEQIGQPLPGPAGHAGVPGADDVADRTSGGELRAKPMASQKDVRPEIFKQVSREAILMTDEWIAYTGLRHHYNHYTVNHCAGEYVSKDSGAHINTMEGAWSLLKRQIYGIHHWVSAKHVHRYVAEATWRFNRRVLKEAPRFAEFLARLDGRLTYKTLTAE